jgi:hypothetical protein
MRRDAGIVDENVQPAEFVAGGIERPLSRGCVGDVTSNADRAPTHSLDLRSDFRESIEAASKQNQVRPMTRKFKRQRAANSA